MLYLMVANQIKFDTLINLLDRNLFYLPERLTIEQFKTKLEGRQYREESNHIHSMFEINWQSIIPDKWKELNPNILHHLESPVKCTSRFINNLISYQILSFTDGASAESFFELFKKNSNWDYGLNGGVSPNAQSVDKRYKMGFTSREEELYGDVTHQIMLIYK